MGLFDFFKNNKPEPDSGDKILVTKTYQCNGMEVVVTVEQSSHDERYIHEGRYRKDTKIGSMEMKHDQLGLKDDFFNDIGFFLKQIEGRELDKQSIWDAHFVLCKNHIKQFGRLVDSDLDSYLDCTMHAVDALRDAQGWSPLITSDGLLLREEFKANSYEAYKDYIYITKRSDYILERPHLVKYTDMC